MAKKGKRKPVARLTDAKRCEIVRLDREGDADGNKLTQDQIAEIAGVSKGSVNATLKAAREGAVFRVEEVQQALGQLHALPPEMTAQAGPPPTLEEMADAFQSAVAKVVLPRMLRLLNDEVWAKDPGVQLKLGEFMVSTWSTIEAVRGKRPVLDTDSKRDTEFVFTDAVAEDAA